MFLKRIYLSLVIMILASCSSSRSIASFSDSKNLNATSQKSRPSEVISERSISENKVDTVVYNEEPEKGTIGNIIAMPDHDLWSRLLQKHVSDNGTVNYEGFLKDKKMLSAYLKDLTENPPNDQWNRDQTLAYWINAYNAFTIHLVLRYYPIQSIKEIDEPWDQRFWKIGSKWYNLNDIEHQILRKMNEPRIHFAINCASVSCPKLINVAFMEETLEEQLTMATKTFLSDQTKNRISQKEINLSKIFQWFSKDFKTKDSTVLDFVSKYSDVFIYKNANVSYQNYNWDLND